MGQSLESLQYNINTINEKLMSHKKCQIQRIISTPHFLCLQCRVTGETFYVYLGRGASYQGLYISSKKPHVDLRVKDRYLDFARKYWRDSFLVSVDQDVNDRVFSFLIKTKRMEAKVFAFWRGRDFFFAQVLKEGFNVSLFKSWEGKTQLNMEDWNELKAGDIFKDIGYGKINNTNYKTNFDLEEYLLNETKDKVSNQASKRLKKKKMSLKDKLLKELSDIEKGISMASYAESDLETIETIGKGRFRIKLYEVEGHYKKRDLVYSKVKQWKKSKEIILKRIDKVKDELTQKKETEVRQNKKIISPIWFQKKNVETIVKHERYISFNYNEFECFLGRNSSENDYIRSSIAKKSDLWFHIDQMKSGHLFVRGGSPSPGDMTTLASALCELCKINISEIPLVYTKVTNLKGVKGQRGAVIFKKEKRITLFFDQQWRQKVSKIDEVDNF